MENHYMIQKCLTAEDLIRSGRISVLIMLLSLIGLWGTLDAQPCADAAQEFSWRKTNWTQGQKEGHFYVPWGSKDDSVAASVHVSTASEGTFHAFGVSTPYIDGKAAWYFGKEDDLGVIFDPAPGQGHSVVIATLSFEKPVTCLSFEISDIDASGPRKDSVFVYANAKGGSPAMTALSAEHTMVIDGGSAVASGYPSGPSRSGSSLQNQDAGSILVDFGQTVIESVTVRYMEASGKGDPGGRGIGLFGNLTLSEAELEPMQLIDFAIDRSETCEPIVRWSTLRELDLDQYTVDYSYDGYNYSEALRINARNAYTDTNFYEVLLPRKLNNDNHFRLQRRSQDGTEEILHALSISGEDCFSFSSVNIFPNPSSKDYFLVEIGTSRRHQTQIAILDHAGKQVFATKYELKVGSNWLKVNSLYFPPGVYHVRLVSGDEIVTRKVSII